MRAVLVLVSIVLPACMSGDGMQTKLRDASTEYNRSLRWRDVDVAAEYLPAESQQIFLAKHEEMGEELVVVDYELTRLDLDKTTGVAASRAQIWWHTDDSTVLETTMVDQLWQFHEGRFVLVDERRSGGERLSLFAEFLEDEHPWLPGLEHYRKTRAIGEDNKKKKGRRPAAKKKGGPVTPPPSWGPGKDRSLAGTSEIGEGADLR